MQDASAFAASKLFVKGRDLADSGDEGDELEPQQGTEKKEEARLLAQRKDCMRNALQAVLKAVGVRSRNPR